MFKIEEASVESKLVKLKEITPEFLLYFEYNLTIFFKTGTDNDINLMNVQNKLQQVQSLLPQEVLQQGLTAENKVGGAGAIILNLASEDESWNQLDLTNYANIYVRCYKKNKWCRIC